MLRCIQGLGSFGRAVDSEDKILELWYSAAVGVFLPIDDTGHLNCLLCQCCKGLRIYICSVRTKKAWWQLILFFFPAWNPIILQGLIPAKIIISFPKLIQIIIIAVGPEVGRKLHKVLLHFLKGKQNVMNTIYSPIPYLWRQIFYKRYVSYQIKVVFVMDLIS